eukprot:COSAG05_NODE_1062_length_5993_cov_8.045640_9_plen_66_part_00
MWMALDGVVSYLAVLAVEGGGELLPLHRAQLRPLLAPQVEDVANLLFGLVRVVLWNPATGTQTVI